MKPEDVRYGQRIQVNLPGIGDHGHVGTVKKVRGSMCSIHLDRDQRPEHVIVLYAADLDQLPDELPDMSLSASQATR